MSVGLRSPFSQLRPTGLVDYPPGAEFGPRRMRDYEFVWIIAGDCVYVRDGERFSCPVDSVVLCTPGTVDHFIWDRHKPTRHAFFHFDLKKGSRRWPARARWPVVRTLHEQDIVLAMFRFMIDCPEDLRHLSAEHMLKAWLAGQTTPARVEPAAPHEAVSRALELLRKRVRTTPHEPITLQDLADAAMVTPEHLCRLFKRSTGTTPVQTVRLARLDRAAELIARTNFGLAEIATLTGFASPFHFSRCFRAAFGRSPRDVRNDIRAGGLPPLSRLRVWLRGPAVLPGPRDQF
jgi:AraC family transcriptional regulator